MKNLVFTHILKTHGTEENLKPFATIHEIFKHLSEPEDAIEDKSQQSYSKAKLFKNLSRHLHLQGQQWTGAAAPRPCTPWTAAWKPPGPSACQRYAAQERRRGVDPRQHRGKGNGLGFTRRSSFSMWSCWFRLAKGSTSRYQVLSQSFTEVVL